MEFIVDFGSWTIEAENEKEVKEKVSDRFGQMDYPDITNIEEVE